MNPKNRIKLLYGAVALLALADPIGLHAGDSGDRLPEFSWDRVPVYAHFGYDPNLKPEQYDFLGPGFHQKDKELMKRPHEELVRLAREHISFPLASFLIAAGPNCYFQYTWGWGADCGTFVWYPEFDKPLGAPKGDAKRDGFKYTREFEHASVLVDLETKTGKIDWK